MRPEYYYKHMKFTTDRRINHTETVIIVVKFRLYLTCTVVYIVLSNRFSVFSQTTHLRTLSNCLNNISTRYRAE